MEFSGTHVRQRILVALEAAAKAVPNVNEVTLGAPFGDHPRKGSLIDIAFLEEDDIVKAGGGSPSQGTLTRPLAVGVRVKGQVPFSMTLIEFEGLVGDAERAIVSIDPEQEMVDDIYLSNTAWKYGQDGRTSEVEALLIYGFVYKTPANDPGKSI